jgi:hypothetical protein
MAYYQGDAMSKLFEEMAQGTAEARAYMDGKRKGYKVTLPETVDVRAIRKRLRLSQGRFADRFGLSVDAFVTGSPAAASRKPPRERFSPSLPPTRSS